MVTESLAYYTGPSGPSGPSHPLTCRKPSGTIHSRLNERSARPGGLLKRTQRAVRPKGRNLLKDGRRRLRQPRIGGPPFWAAAADVLLRFALKLRIFRTWIFADI